MINYRLTFRNSTNGTGVYYSGFGLNIANMQVDWSLSSANLSYTMASLPNLNKFNANINNLPFNTSFANFFRYANKINNIDCLSKWNICNVTNVDNMFLNCFYMNYYTHLDSWDTSNIINFCNMFSYCSMLTILYINDWNMINAQDCSFMFYQDSRLNTITNIDNWDVGNVTNFSSMFYNTNACNNKLYNWDVSSGVNFSSMFGNCRNMISLNFSKWDMSNATNLYYMFGYCNKLKTLDFSDWNVKKVYNLSSMFSHCNNLSNLNIVNWNVPNVTSLSYMFSYCNNLTVNILQDLAKMCLTAINVTYKNLMNTSTYSPLYSSNKQINSTTVGQDLITQLQSAGWTTN